MSGLNDVGNLRGRRSPRAPSTRNVKGKSHARRRPSTSPHPDTMAAPSYDETAEVEAALLRLPTRAGICKLQHPGPTPSPQARESNRLLSPQASGLAGSGSFQGPSSSLGLGLKKGGASASRRAIAECAECGAAARLDGTTCVGPGLPGSSPGLGEITGAATTRDAVDQASPCRDRTQAAGRPN